MDVVVSYLPVGSEEADRFYAQAAIDAGCAFVNALPVFIASDPVWAAKFEAAGLPIVGDDIHVGPSDHVPWLTDRKFAFVRLEGEAFGGVPISMEYKLEVWDSPNSACIIIDAVRAAKIGLDRGVGGPLTSASAYFMKSPPHQLPDDEGRDRVEAFIRGELER